MLIMIMLIMLIMIMLIMVIMIMVIVGMMTMMGVDRLQSEPGGCSSVKALAKINAHQDPYHACKSVIIRIVGM